MKSPAFQFYAQDFLTGVMYLTNEEVGIYIKMLAKQWTDGKIPKKRLGLFVGYDWVNLSEEIKEKFTDKGEYVINERLEIEREKKSNFLKKQSENGKKGGRPSKSNKLKNPNDTQINPLEEEDEKEEEYVIDKDYENVKIKKAEMFKLIDKYSHDGFLWMVDKLSNYKLSSGKKYKSDYGAINSWVAKEWEKNKSSPEKVVGRQTLSTIEQNTKGWD